MAHEQTSHDDHAVPGTGGASAETREGQQALRLHAGIAVVAFVLCTFVTAVFFWLGSPIAGVVFALLALACLGALGWALRTRRRGTSSRS